MRVSRSALTLSLAGALLGCEAEFGDPRPQWKVVLSTDAAVPQLADRLLVEIVGSDGTVCPACRRQFDSSHPSSWPLSFGVLIPSGGAARLRVQLFRSSLIGPEGTPTGDGFLEAQAWLVEPAASEQAPLPLAMSCFGVMPPKELVAEQSCNPTTGELGPIPTAGPSDPILTVGSWPPAQPVPCGGEAPADMACIPGGAFLLGDALATPIQAPSHHPVPEHLVQLAPFWLDVTELTVGDYLQLATQHPELDQPGQPGDFGIKDSSFCTHDPADAEAVDLPLNCVTPTLAAELCALQDKRLPTEAEWEWAAGNGPAESPFAWGSSDDVCAKAVVARGNVYDNQPGKCLAAPGGGTLTPGPVAVGTSADVTITGVWDLSGNVAEWMADTFAPYDDGDCWAGAHLLVDPVCAVDPTSDRSVRGGHWAAWPYEARVTYRRSDTVRDPRYGFRCARSAE